MCTAQHRHSYLSDSLRLTSEIVADFAALHDSDTTTLQVPSTRRATLGNRAFLVAAARAWNNLPPKTRACSSILTFRRETKSHLFRQSYGCSFSKLLSTLSCTAVLVYKPCKVPPQLFRWWHYNFNIQVVVAAAAVAVAVL